VQQGNEEPLWTPVDLATKWQVRPSWVYKAVESSELPCIRLGKYLRFHPDDIARWLAARRS
jgi:Helix-turn-helix domain